MNLDINVEDNSRNIKETFGRLRVSVNTQNVTSAVYSEQSYIIIPA